MAFLREDRTKAIERVDAYLSDLGYHKLTAPDFPATDIVAAWQGNLFCNGIQVQVIVALPTGYPDVLPKVYITKDFPYLPIPHVDDKLFVCTFDIEEINFFAERVEEVLQKVIEKAREILTEGLDGSNREDFASEFLAYWRLETETTVYSLFHPSDQIEFLQMAFVPWRTTNISLIANKESDIKLFARNLFPDITISKFKQVLYLPFPKPIYPPFPKTIGDLITLMETFDSKYLKAVARFILDKVNSGVIVFSLRSDDDYSLAGLFYTPIDRSQLLKGGFRPKAITANVLRSRIGGNEINRIDIERVDSARLQSRIGSSNSALEDKTVCLVGCGSLGSKIAFQLAQAGIINLILIDNDELVVSNIGRHYCGFLDIGKKKADAVGQRIREHYPCINVECISKSFLSAFEESEQAIVNSDLIISATANTALERKINKLHIDVPNFPSMLYTWIEPFGLASQAVLISDIEEGCFECCLSDDLSYSDRVIENTKESLIQREAGCQTSFTPYSGVDADQASLVASRLALRLLSNDLMTNTKCVFIGDTEKAAQLGADISRKYTDVKPFTILTNGFGIKPDCGACLASKHHA